MTLQRAQEIDLQIVDYAFGGRGIARLETDKGPFVIFVDNTFPGQFVRAKIETKRKTFAEAKLLEVLKRADIETALARATRTAGLLDRPGQPRLDRAGRGVDVMAIEAKPRLQPQAVACAKADGHDLGHIQQADGKGFCLRHRQGHLKPILAGIA